MLLPSHSDSLTNMSHCVYKKYLGIISFFIYTVVALFYFIRN